RARGAQLPCARRFYSAVITARSTRPPPTSTLLRLPPSSDTRAGRLHFRPTLLPVGAYAPPRRARHPLGDARPGPRLRGAAGRARSRPPLAAARAPLSGSVPAAAERSPQSDDDQAAPLVRCLARPTAVRPGGLPRGPRSPAPAVPQPRLLRCPRHARPGAAPSRRRPG